MLRGVSDLLERRVASGEWGTGWQVSVRPFDSVPLDACGGVDGCGEPISVQTRFSVYCAGKPVTALCVGALVDGRELSFDDALGNIVSGIADPALASTTIDDLLRHNAGLGRFPAAQFIVQPFEARERLLLAVRREVGSAFATTYSEFVAWELLRMVIESVTGESFEKAVRFLVLDHLGLAYQMQYTSDPTSNPHLGLNVAVRPHGIEPLLWELSTTNLSEVKASTGLIASASSLADLYLSVGRALDGSTFPVSRETLRAMLAAPEAATYDPVLDRTCKLAAGFQVELQQHHFDGCTAVSFGHTGLSGMTFAGCDVDRRIAFAVHVNGFLERSRTSKDRRAEDRRAMAMAALLREVALSPYEEL